MAVVKGNNSVEDYVDFCYRLERLSRDFQIYERLTPEQFVKAVDDECKLMREEWGTGD